ncbi:MAG: right-handed parallel beta-helix repeat-containing protein [Verrucomicrobiota bacterium]
MNTLRTLVTVCALLAGAGTGNTLAATYYVDATRGEDTRDGLKSESAWRTLPRVNRASLAPGDVVLFRRGETFRGQLIPQSGAATGVITYGSYGEGAKPIFLGSVAADRAEDWVPVKEGLWITAPLRFETVGAPTDLQRANWTMHQEGGAACGLTKEKSAPDGASTLRLACRQNGTKANHIQLTMFGLTVEEGEYYLLTFRARATKPFTPSAVSVMKSGSPYTSFANADAGLPVLGTNWSELTIRLRARQTAQDARLTLYLGGALPADSEAFLQPGQFVKARCNQTTPLSVDVGNIIFDHGKSTGVKKWSEADLRQAGDYLYDARTWQVKLCSNGNPASNHRSTELALRKHIIDQGGRGYVTYENLDLRYGAAHGVGGGSTHHITIRGCDISFIGGGHQNTRPDGKPVRFGNGIEFWSSASDCLVEDCRIWEIYDAALTNQGDGTNVQQNITYRRNVIWNSEYSFEFWNRGPASRTQNIVFEHNTCVAAGRGWGYGQRPDPNGRHLMFYSNTAVTTNVVIRYNIFCEAADSCLRLHGRDWTAALTMDYNCWFRSSGPLVLWDKESIGPEGFAAFMQAHNLDQHSMVANPKFIDAAQRDYRLAPDSPARRLSDAGKPVGALP